MYQNYDDGGIMTNYYTLFVKTQRIMCMVETSYLRSEEKTLVGNCTLIIVVN